MSEISNSHDQIDSRDVISRIEELESERTGLENAVETAEGEVEDAEMAEDGDEADRAEALAFVRKELAEAKKALAEWHNSEESKELAVLQELAKQGEDYASDWHYGAQLIRHDYFTEYCEELVKDIGDMPSKIPDYIVIDWEATADNLKVDYTEIEFDGVTYYVR